MKSEDAMLVWTPLHDYTKHDATAGHVQLVSIPETNTRGYIASAGACDAGWREMGEADRIKSLTEIAEAMIEDDNIPREAVYAELAKVDGF